MSKVSTKPAVRSRLPPVVIPYFSVVHRVRVNLMASRLPTILPPLTDAEALEVASIYSIANTDYAYGTRPFRQVHHTTSAVALVGGGSSPKPGEITLANHGVLFLDELPR